MNTKIIIQGMGGLINFDMLVVQKALEAAGYIVQVENREADWSGSTEDWYEQVLENKLRSKKKDTIQLIAKHVPWGG